MPKTTQAVIAATTARRVSLNAASNVAVVAFDMGTSLLLMAYMLRVLPRDMYGIWAVTGAVFAYSTVLQLGLNSAVNYFVPPLLLKRDYVELSKIASTAAVFYGAGSMILLIATAVIAVYFPTWVKIPESATGVARLVVVMVGTYFVVAMPLGVFQGVLSGMQRYVAMNVARLTCRVTRVILIFALLWSGYGLLGLAAGHVIARLAESLVMPFLVKRYLPELRLKLSLASWAVFKQMFGYSAFTLLWSLTALVRDRAAFVVIGLFLGTGAAAAYQIPVTLMLALDAATQSLAAVAKPAASALFAEQRFDAIESLVVRGVRGVFALLIPAVAFAALYAEVLIPMWVGDAYPDVPRLVSFLIVAQLLLTSQAVAAYVLIGINRHRVLAGASLVAALVGVVLMTCLAVGTDMALMGIAWGASVPMLLMGVVFLPAYTCRVLKMPLWRYVRGVFLRPLVAALPFLGIVFAVRFWIEPLGLSNLIIAAALSLPVLGVCYFKGVATSQERGRISDWLRGVLSRRGSKRL